jgi:hypothetical protein
VDAIVIRQSRSVSKLSTNVRRDALGEPAGPVPHRRALDATPRERRVGDSWLSRRTGLAIALLWLAWPGLLVALIAVGALLSVAVNHGTQELPFAFTRSARRGLVLSAVVPPSCLTILWYRMRGRRRGRRPEHERVGRMDDAAPLDETS